MSTILEPGQRPSLVQRPHDPYWDAPASRADVMRLVNDLALNDNVLSNRSDTAHLIINLICEKLNITRGEIEVYVAKKSAEVKALNEKILAEAEAKQKEEANG